MPGRNKKSRLGQGSRTGRGVGVGTTSVDGVGRRGGGKGLCSGDGRGRRH